MMNNMKRLHSLVFLSMIFTLLLLCTSCVEAPATETETETQALFTTEQVTQIASQTQTSQQTSYPHPTMATTPDVNMSPPLDTPGRGD
jgi:PBP1b-binding outer membrane lipoprotein LpoB